MSRSGEKDEGGDAGSLADEVVNYDRAADHLLRESDFEQLRLVDPEPAISIEWLRHRAHRAQLQLQRFVDGTALYDDPAHLSAEIRGTIAELEAAIHQIEREKPASMAHYGD